MVPTKQEETKMEADLIEQVARENDIVIPRKKVMKSVCEMHRKCNICMVTYKVKEGVSHKCGHGQCTNCLNYVDLYSHQCFIVSDKYRANKWRDIEFKKEQRCLEAIKEMTTIDGKKVQEVATRPITFKDFEEERMKQQRDQEPQEQVGPTREQSIEAVKKKLQDLGVDVEEIADDKLETFYLDHYVLTGGKKEKHKELVFADIECCIDDNRKFTPNLICFERETSDEKYHFWGRMCIRLFLEQLTKWVKEEEKMKGPNTAELQVYFHNFRGFDGVFIIKQLYDMNLKVSKVLMTGQKILYFECGHLKFKDSMSFLNMPLENFTKTFGLTELKKGYFPHKFNREENLNYEGLIPDLKYYETECMNTKKKEAVEKWHGEEVLKGESWKLKKELLEYCQSDVKLLREGCLTFANDFEKE